MKKCKIFAVCAVLATLFSPLSACDCDDGRDGNREFKMQNETNLNRKAINISGNWRISIVEIDGAFVRVPESAEEAFVQIGSNQISGSAGCNNFMMGYTTSENPQRLNIEEGASTRKMCHPQEVMQFEDAFLRIFNGTFVVEKNFEGITLVRDNIKVYLVRS